MVLEVVIFTKGRVREVHFLLSVGGKGFDSYFFGICEGAVSYKLVPLKLAAFLGPIGFYFKQGKLVKKLIKLGHV